LLQNTNVWCTTILARITKYNDRQSVRIAILLTLSPKLAYLHASVPVSDGQNQSTVREGQCSQYKAKHGRRRWSITCNNTVYYVKNGDLEWFQIKSQNFKSNPNQITRFPNQILVLQIK